MKQDTDFPWGHKHRYNDFPTFFRNRFSMRVQKVSIDAGFTCPNRDGSKGLGGCTYCNNQTFNPSYCHLDRSVSVQLDEGVKFFSYKYPTMKYLAYFQAYTNTYAPLQNLKELYEEALAHPQVIGLVLATRPDCLPDEVLDYLQQLSERYYIMIELGIESVNDEALKRINRGHLFDESARTLERLAKRNLQSCAHMILGLPGETTQTMLDQARILSTLPVNNLKLHQLQIHRNTVMAYQFQKYPEQFNLFNHVEDYIELVIDYLELLSPKIVIERFVSQSPPELLIAPKWGLKNFEFVSKLEKRLELQNTWQGRLFQT